MLKCICFFACTFLEISNRYILILSQLSGCCSYMDWLPEPYKYVFCFFWGGGGGGRNLVIIDNCMLNFLLM